MATNNTYTSFIVRVDWTLPEGSSFDSICCMKELATKQDAWALVKKSLTGEARCTDGRYIDLIRVIGIADGIDPVLLWEHER